MDAECGSFCGKFACLQQRQCLGDRFPAQHHQLVMQSFEGVLRSNGDFLSVQHIAGVQSRIHLHDGHTSLGFSVDDHSLDRRCPAVFRKEGCMDVQTSVFWQIQNLLRQDLSERRHDADICLIFFQFFDTFRFPDLLWLIDRDIMCKCTFFYRSELHFFASALWLVRLGHHCGDLMALCDQCLQRSHGKIGSSHKYDLHSLSPFRKAYSSSSSS